MNTSAKHCLECASAIEGRRIGKEFCSSQCRLAFNNRRMQRGAEIYDLFRALRRERGVAKELGLWSEICRLERQWQDEDEAARPGRRSYMPPRKAITNLREKGSLPRGKLLAQNCLSSRRAR